VASLQDDAPELRVHLLGGFTITLGDQSLDTTGWRLRKAQHLVKLLLLAPGHRLHRERVFDLLWPDLDLDAAANNLHYIMHAARITLARLWETPTLTMLAQPRSEPHSRSHSRSGHRALLRLRQQIIALDPPWPLWLDVDAFDEAANAARLGSDPQLYETAIALYGGELLPDDRYEDWAANRRESLRATYHALLFAVAKIYISRGAQEAAIAAYQRLLAADSAHEEAHQYLMRLYAESGQRHEALRQYERLQVALQRELEVLPSQESQRLYADIVAGRVAAESLTLAPAVSFAPSAPPVSPAPAARNAPVSVALLPIVGREDALARLRHAWADAVAVPQMPQAVLLVGEAGIGKTRVAEETLIWAARQSHEVGQPITTALASCYAAEGDLPYAAVVSWLRSQALWPGALALDEVWQAEVARILPELLVEHPHLRMPAPLPEHIQRPRLFEALARAVRQGGQPLLLVIDDLQWCERETLEWLRYLLRQTPQASLVVLGTVRAEEITPDHPLIAFMAELRHTQQLTEIGLGPLDAADTAMLGARIAGHALNAAQAERLYTDTEGNPLFVVEQVRAGFLDQPQALANADDGSIALGVPEYPERMKATLAWRLGQLSPEAHNLASLASVVGREFSVDLLFEASRAGSIVGSIDENAVVRALEELQRRRIIRDHGDGSYDFSHDKHREAAYAELSTARRRALHRRVARALEVVSADALDEVMAQLAMHYERGGEAPKAVAALERAGELAIQRGLLPRAREYLQCAIALAPESDQMRLNEELGDSYWVTDAYHHYSAALNRWRNQDATSQNPLIGARLLRKMLFVVFRSDVVPHPSSDELESMAGEAYALALRSGNGAEVQRARIARIGLHWSQDWSGHVVTLDDIHHEQAAFMAIVDDCAARGDWADVDTALDTLTSSLLWVGAFDEALEIAHRRLRTPQQLPPHAHGDVVGMIANTHFMVGNFEQCMATYREAWRTSRPDAPLFVANSKNGAYSALLSGAWDELDTFIAINERVWEDSGHTFTDTLMTYWPLLHVGRAREDQAAIDLATTKLEKWMAIESKGEHTISALLAAYLADDVEPLTRGQPPDKWILNLSFALMFFNDRGIPAPPAYITRASERVPEFAQYPRLCIRAAEAIVSPGSELLEEVIAEADAQHLIPHAARLRIVLAQRTGDRAHLDRARPVLERLGDRQFLRRLEAVATTLP
jgi:DNA-binding SARP family transcriptional activator